jgi:hypothetical protein
MYKWEIVLVLIFGLAAGLIGARIGYLKGIQSGQDEAKKYQFTVYSDSPIQAYLNPGNIEYNEKNGLFIDEQNLESCTVYLKSIIQKDKKEATE